MIWVVAVVFVILWMVGLASGYLGLFVHTLYVIAILLLLVGIKREVSTYWELNHTLYKSKRRRLFFWNTNPL